jgi:hypothetical protein
MSSDDRWVGEEDPEAKLPGVYATGVSPRDLVTIAGIDLVTQYVPRLDDMIISDSAKAYLMQILERSGIRTLQIEDLKASQETSGFSVKITLVGRRENSRF